MIYQLNDGQSVFALNKENGIVPQRVNLGSPVVRKVSQSRAGTNGEINRTKFFGGRVITAHFGIAHEMTGSIDHDLYVIDQLREWGDPELRYWFEYGPDATSLRRFAVSPYKFADQFDEAQPSRFIMETLQWQAFNGVSESTDLSVTEIAVGISAELGRSYDRQGDRVYPESGLIGAKDVINAGTTKANPVVTIYGPCVGPKVTNETTGQQLKFEDDFALTAGQFLVIDFLNGTVLLNGDPTNPRYNNIDFPNSEWWVLKAKTNRIKYQPVSSSPPSKVKIEYRNTYL